VSLPANSSSFPCSPSLKSCSSPMSGRSILWQMVHAMVNKNNWQPRAYCIGEKPGSCPYHSCGEGAICIGVRTGVGADAWVVGATTGSGVVTIWKGSCWCWVGCDGLGSLGG
jgi:hypothetical protein